MGESQIGSSFDDFLHEEAMLEEATAVAEKRVTAWRIEREMAVQTLTGAAKEPGNPPALSVPKQ